MSTGTIEVKEAASEEQATLKISFGGEIYKMLEITPDDNIKNSVTEVSFTFKVPVAWLIENGLDASSITLSKWDGTKWVEITTTVTKTDSDNVYFTATSTSFSTYAIGESTRITSATIFIRVLSAISQYYSGGIPFIDVIRLITSYYFF